MGIRNWFRGRRPLNKRPCRNPGGKVLGIYPGVVPSVVAGVDEHGVSQSVLPHLCDFVFNGRFNGGLLLRMFGVMERELGIESPNFQARVDD